MRVPPLVVIALVGVFGLSSASAAQRVRLPRRGTTPPPATLPPTAGQIAQSLAYTRSHWSVEGYSVVSTVDIPAATAAGGVSRFTAAGAGTHGDYRITEHFSATMDATASIPGGPANVQTFEAGTRYSPRSYDHAIRPFVDTRALYARMYDTFSAGAVPEGAIVGAGDESIEAGRYSRGLGGVAGAGVEFGLTRSLALTTEVSAMRGRLSSYRMTGGGGLPAGDSYWTTSVRYALGLRFNPVSALHMQQKATP